MDICNLEVQYDHEDYKFKIVSPKFLKDDHSFSKLQELIGHAYISINKWFADNDIKAKDIRFAIDYDSMAMSFEFDVPGCSEADTAKLIVNGFFC